MRLKYIAMLSLTGLLLAGCESDEYHKVEQGDVIGLLHPDQVEPIPAEHLPPDVLQTFHSQFPKATLTSAEERHYEKHNRYFRLYYVLSNGERGQMDYNLDSDLQ